MEEEDPQDAARADDPHYVSSDDECESSVAVRSTWRPKYVPLPASEGVSTRDLLATWPATRYSFEAESRRSKGGLAALAPLATPRAVTADCSSSYAMPLSARSALTHGADVRPPLSARSAPLSSPHLTIAGQSLFTSGGVQTSPPEASPPPPPHTARPALGGVAVKAGPATLRAPPHLPHLRTAHRPRPWINADYTRPTPPASTMDDFESRFVRLAGRARQAVGRLEEYETDALLL
eukprot:2917290-Prymnesium_polylepis.1